jgi:hypothetical protein
VRHPFDLGREEQLDKAFFARNPDDRKRSDDPALLEVSNQYNDWANFPPLQWTPYTRVDRPWAKRIAKAYARARSCPECLNVREAYHQFRYEIDHQFEMMPVVVEYYGEPGSIADPNLETTGGFVGPYQDSWEMIQDVREHGHLWVWRGGDPVPLLPDVDNWKFRAVHDVFGHAAHGLSFGWRGEGNAWAQHTKMFSPLAREVLTTETLGQVSWVFAGPYALHAAKGEFHFPEQKAIILPHKFQSTPQLREAYKEFVGFF